VWAIVQQPPTEPEPFNASGEPGPPARPKKARRRKGAGGPPGSGPPSARRQAGMAALTLGALGVVFGDIGTSPLYALQTVFTADNHAVHTGHEEVYGVVSLIFWAITIIVSIEFVIFIMRADNEGEGGIMALIALIERVNLRGRLVKPLLVALGVFGAALFYGDGMITPAISVLSAVEGLKVVTPDLNSLIVPITLVIITGLFAIQRFGTAAVGNLFGPVMIVWFLVIGVTGLGQVLSDPSILRALLPSYGASFLVEHGWVAFLSLGSVVLAVTGAEALYADMGHFGRPPIRRAWFMLVFPALTLNYLGQGSLVLNSPEAISNPFFLLMPHWSRIPMVVLATAATVIASQAVISGAYSVTRQAIQLGFLPRLSIRHTSESQEGQVYAPGINWALFIAVVALVIGFGSSTKLASAYGIAVTGTLGIDTILFFVVVRAVWRKPLWVSLAGAGGFFIVDLAFLGANLPKVITGGWVPLVVAGVIFMILMTWQKGRAIVTRNRTEEEGPLLEFIEGIRSFDPPVNRVPGSAIFLNQNLDTTPLAMRANVEHNHTLHETVVIVTVETMRVPHVEPEERLVADDLGFTDDGISHLRARFGFKDDPDVPAALRLAVAEGYVTNLDVDGASYFLSRITIHPTGEPGMRMWRKRLFTALSRNAASPVEYFALPEAQTVTMGSAVDL
jgi:KUP system potassium uptake protein